MICSDYGKNYRVNFTPSSKKLTVDADGGIFYPQMVPRQYLVSKISPDAVGYKIVASGGWPARISWSTREQRRRSII
jgi:hypothetical protein